MFELENENITRKEAPKNQYGSCQSEVMKIPDISDPLQNIISKAYNRRNCKNASYFQSLSDMH